MTKKRKALQIGGALALTGLVFAAAAIWYLNRMMSQPLYKFGSVSGEMDLRGPLEPPEEQDEASSWRVESDILISYEAYGEGEPVLVVHGGPGIPYARLWKGLAPLTATHRFYFYHQRGCGDSTRPIDRLHGDFYSNMMEVDRTLGIGAQIADIERIRRILGEEQITIIGHSFGGFIATMYAAEFPTHVKKLVLVAPAGVLTPPSDSTDIFALTRARLGRDSLDAFDAVKADYFDFGNIFSKSDDELVELHQRMGKFIIEAMDYTPKEFTEGPKSGGWAVFAVYFSGGRSPNFLPALKDVVAPTLIVHGEDDEIALIGSQSYQAIRDSRFVMLEREHNDRRAGHMVFDDSPQAFAESVREFLAEKKTGTLSGGNDNR